MRTIAAVLSLLSLFSVENLAVLHGRVFRWNTTGAAGTSGVAGTSGAAGAAGSTGGSATGGSATGGSATGGSATGGSATGGATGGTPGTGGGTGGATGGTGGGAGCGDGVRQDGEACDGSDLQSAACVTLGFGGGTLACSSTCQFDASACTGGALTPTVTATVTSCAVPCGVFFDATGTSGLSGGDYVGANWTWDFRDVGAAHPAAIGFIAGHVFDTAGTYVVTTRARDLAGAAGWATTTITVAAWPYTTYYVSASGNDSNNGLATTTPFLTIAHALTFLGSNKAVLLRRGDTFSGPSSTTTLSGAELLGSYSDPAAPSSVMPVWTSHVPANAFNDIFHLTGTNPRIVDIKVVATNIFNVVTFVSSTNAIVERMEATGIGFDDGGHNAGENFFSDATAVSTFVVGNNLHDFNGYGMFATANKLAIVGNSVTAFGGIDHGFRIAAGDRTFVSQNYIRGVDTADSPFSGITIRGNNTKSVVAQNDSNRLVEFTPQNAESAENVQDGLADGNMINNVRAEGTFDPSMNITAKHIVVRNNIFVGSSNCLKVFGMPLEAANWVDQISIYNNTCRFVPSPSYPPDFGANFATQGSTTGSISLKNNIWNLELRSGGSYVFLSSSGGGTHSEDHNLGYDSLFGGFSPGFTGAGDIANSNPRFVATTGATAFRIGSTSAARNTGTATAAWHDPDSVARPKEGVFDIGAFEYYAP